MRKFNWDYLYFKIKEKGYTISYYSAKILNKHQSYLPYYKTRNEAPPQNVITYMIKNLELDENALWQIDEPREESSEPNVVLEKVADTSAGAVVCEVVEPETPEAIEESEDKVVRYVEMPRDFMTLEDMLYYLEDKTVTNPTSTFSRAIIDAVTIIRRKCSDEELQGFFRIGGVVRGFRI